jgi:hypothetical protein
MSAGGRQALQWIISPREPTQSGDLVPSAELVPSAFLVVCPAIEVSIDVVEGLGHDYPADFVDRVEPVLAKLVASG